MPGIEVLKRSVDRSEGVISVGIDGVYDIGHFDLRTDSIERVIELILLPEIVLALEPEVSEVAVFELGIRRVALNEQEGYKNSEGNHDNG